MTRSVEDRINRTLRHAADTTAVDIEALQRLELRQRRSRWLRRGLAGAAAAATTAAVAITVVAVGAPQPRIADVADPASESGTGETTAEPNGTTDGADWNQLDFQGAVDRLIEMTRQLPDPLVATEEEDVVIVEVSANAWAGETADLDRTTIHLRADGTHTMIHEELTDTDADAGLAGWRAALAQAEVESVDETVIEFHRGDGSSDGLDAAADEADGPAEPDPSSTVRAGQAYAFLLVLEDLLGTQPQQIARERQLKALEILRDLESPAVEYLGTVTDLRGRDVVVLAGNDRASDTWVMMAFDAETGYFAGAGDERDGELLVWTSFEPPVLAPAQP